MDLDHFRGRRLLVVEDDTLIALMIEDMLEEAGYKVAGVASEIEQAKHMAMSLRIDAAVLDLDLNGSPTFVVADTLHQQGVPFIFATGHDGGVLPARFSSVPVLDKPFARDELIEALGAAFR